MPQQFRRPVRRPSASFDNVVGGLDPAEALRLAHATAGALLSRARADESGETAERMIAYAAEHGIDDVAQLWAEAPASSLPGALWRLHLIAAALHADAEVAALMYERGRQELPTVDAVVAGAPAPASPAELRELIGTIMRGVFHGDFAVALERAAAFCRVYASGATHVADDSETVNPERASELTKRALRLAGFAEDLSAAASAWRRGLLV